MSLTVNSAPDGFRPVGGGELLYVFTEGSISGKENFRVEIELNGLSVPVFEFRPDADSVITCDIAPMLRSVLAMEEAASSRLVSTYVKYQAKWDGGSDAQVSLSSDVIYAYVGVDHELNHRTQFEVTLAGGALNKFLIPTTKLYAFSGYKTYIEFLGASNLGVASRVDYFPTSGGTVLLGNFNGYVPGLKSFDSTFSEGGTVKIYSAAAVDYVCEIEVVCLTGCTNPVYLKWINDLGGLSNWLFSFNQVYGLSPQENYRNKILTVSSDVVTFDSWVMLQELNKNRVEYGENRALGLYCKDATDETNQKNIIPIPVEAETQTKFNGHNFTLGIKYPRIPNILI